MIDGLYVSCSRGRIDAQYDASIRDWRNCDDLTLLLAAVQIHTHNTHNQQEMQNMLKPIFRKHTRPRPPGIVGEVRREWPLFPMTANMIDHYLPR